MAFLMETPATAKLPFLRSDCESSSERFQKSFCKSEFFRIPSSMILTYRGRNTYHCMRRRRFAPEDACIYDTIRLWNDNWFLWIVTLFFSFLSGSSGVKSISDRIGENFIRTVCWLRSDGLHRAYCGPFLACAARVSWPPSLGVFERMYTGSKSKHWALE